MDTLRPDKSPDPEFPENKCKEEELALLSFALDHVSEAAYLAGNDGRFHYVNAAACTIMGYSRDELLGLSVIDVDPDVTEESWRDTWRQNREAGSVTFEAVHKTRDGRTFPVEINSSYFEFKGLAYILGLVRDISERKKAEEEIHYRERKFRRLAENSPDIIARYDTRCRLVYGNPLLFESLGVDREAILGRTPLESNPQDEMGAGAFQRSMMDAMASAEPQEIEIEVTHPSGRRSVQSIRIVAERTVDNKVIGTLTICRDITERKRMEETLENERLLLKTLVATIPEPVWVKDPHGSFLICNAAFASLFDKSESDIIGTTDYDHVDPALAEFFQQKDREAMEATGPRMNEEWVTYAGDGHRELWETIKTRLTDKDGHIIGVLGVARDISKHREMQEMLREKEQYQRALLDNFPFMVWLKDTRSRLLAVNQAYAETAGRSSTEEFRGRTDMDFWPADLARKYRRDDREVLLSGSKKHVEELVADNGTRRWFETYKAPVVVDGILMGTVGFARDITDRKQIEAEKHRLIEILEQSIDFVGMADMEGNLYYHNRAALKMIGFEDGADLTRLKIADMHPEWATKMIHETVFPILLEKGVWRGESALLHRDGHEIPVSQLVTLHRGPDGQPEYTSTIMQDITERKNLEAELKEREKRYREIFEHSQDSIFLLEVTPEGRFRNLEFNPAFERATGARKELFLGKTIDETNPPEVASAVNAKYWRCLELGSVYEEELELDLPVGRRVFHSTLIPVRDENGNFYRITGITRDVTERRDLLEALATQEREFRTLAENAPDNIIRYDRNCRLVYMNPAMQKTLLLDASNLQGAMGKTPLEAGIGSPETNARHEASIRQVIETGQSNEIEITMQDGSGAPRTHSIHLIAERDAEGAISGVIAIGRDVTERRIMEDSLRESETRYRESSNLLQSIFDSASDVIILALDRGYRYLTFNDTHRDTARRLWGVDIAVGMNMLDVFSNEEDREFARQGFDAVFSGRDLSVESKHAVIIDGRTDYEYWQNYGSPIFSDSGEVTGLTLFGINTTDRKHMEELLHEREQAFRALVENSPDTISRYDDAFRRVYVNPAMRDLLGRPEGEILGKTPMELSPTPDSDRFMQIIRTVFETGKEYMGEILFRDAKGNNTWVHIRVVPEFGVDQRVSTVLVLGRDIDNLKKAEAALKESETRYRENNNLLQSIFESPTGMSIYTMDREYRLLAFNNKFREAARRLWNAEIAVGMNMLEAIDTEEHREFARQGFDQVLAGRSFSLESREAVVRDGVTTYEYHDNYGAPIRDDNGEIIGLTVFAAEITERKRIETELAAREEELRFLAEYSPGMIGTFRFRPDGTICMPYVSSNIFDLFGLRPEDVAEDASSLLAKTHPEDAERVRESIRESARTMSIWHQEYRILHPTRGERWMEGNTNPMPHPDGGIVWYGYVQDITDRKRAEEKQHESEAIFSAAFHQSPVALSITSLKDQIFIDVNDVYLRESGFTREELVGHTWDYKRLWPDPKEREPFRKAVLREGRALEHDMTFRRKDGSVGYAMISASLISVRGEPCVLSQINVITEQRKAEKALRETEAIFSTAFHQSPAALSITTLKDQIFLDINNVYVRESGYSREEILSKKNDDIKLWAVPEERDAFRKAMASEGKATNMNITFRRKDGSIGYALISGAVISVRGEPCVLAQINVITAQKMAEKALEESERHYRSIFENMPDSLYVFDVASENQYIISDINPAAVQATGIPKEAAVGSPMDPNVERPETFETYRECVSTGKTIHYEDHFTYDGKTVYSEASIVPIKNDAGKVYRLMAFARDITERKRSEETIRRLNDDLSATLQAVPDPLFELDRSGVCVNIWAKNPLLLGRSRAELLGHSVRELLSLEVTDGIMEAIREADETGYCYGKEIHFAPDERERERWFELSVSKKSETISDGRFIVLSRNISDRKQAEKDRLAREMAETTIRTKNEFLSFISHEIRTPLNVILGCTELLVPRLTSSEQLSYVRSIRNSSEVLQKLISDFLDLSRIEAGKIRLDPQPLNLVSLFAEIRQMFDPRMEERGLDFRLELTPGIPGLVLLDGGRLRQIIINVFDNALKFTDRGFIRIAIRSIPEENSKREVRLSFEVEDSGTGIPEEERERIFLPFMQRSDQDQTKFGGSGLGLSITRKILQLMEGTITVGSGASGGALFSILLRHVPVLMDAPMYEESTARSATGTRENSNFLPATILIVDDNDEIRRVLRGQLESLPFYIVEADNGRTALDLARMLHPEVIFMDYNMPAMDGLSAAKEIAKSEKLKGSRIILITAESGVSRESSLNAFFDGMLLKPIDRSTMLAELSRHLPRSEEASRGEIRGSYLKGTEDREFLLKWKGMEPQNLRSGIDFDKIVRFCDAMEKDSLRRNASVARAWARRMREAASSYNVAAITRLWKEYDVEMDPGEE